MADQENLLQSYDRDHDFVGSATVSYRNSSYYTQRPQFKKNLLLTIISVLIATCLTIYVYLNYIAINGNRYTKTDDAHYNPHKPLSRRKPILDHESIFSESGPSLLKISDLLAHCIVALQVGGERVVELSLKNKRQLKEVASKGKTKEGLDDIVTGADMRSHEAILNTIKDTYRWLRIVSEEDTTSAFENLKLEDDILPISRSRFARMLSENLQEIEKESYNWPLVSQQETLVWVDPLDATKEYSENLTEYVTLMACIVHQSVPIAGIIHKPFSNKTYWSLKDKTRRNIARSSDLASIWSIDEPRSGSDNLRITVSRSHAGDVEKFIRSVYGERVSIIPSGGSGYKTIELIKGNVNAYIHVTHIKKWDICAPHAILSSLPYGNMTDLHGDQITFGDLKDKVVKKGLIATLDETRHKELVGSFRNYVDSNHH